MKHLHTHIAALIMLVVALTGCDALPWQEDEREQEYRRQKARGMATFQARQYAEMVALTAGEKAQLHPRSERRKRSDEARENLDEIVPRETREKILQEEALREQRPR